MSLPICTSLWAEDRQAIAPRSRLQQHYENFHARRSREPMQTAFYMRGLRVHADAPVHDDLWTTECVRCGEELVQVAMASLWLFYSFHCRPAIAFTADPLSDGA